MIFSLFRSRLSILCLIGWSLCIEDNDPWDTVFPDGDPWDIESSEEDSANISVVFSQHGEGEVVITKHSPPNWVMIPITSEANEIPTEVPDQIGNEPMSTAGTSHNFPVNQASSVLNQIAAENVITPENRSKGRYVAIGTRSRGSDRVKEAFTNLKPMTLKPDSLSQEELEIKFLHQKNHLLWREMIDYPLHSYYGYWGEVCNYFWYKPDPSDKRFRGCFIRILADRSSQSLVRLIYFPERNIWTQLLRCKCYYYIVRVTKPDSDETTFAIHKHTENEYFLLKNISRMRSRYTITNLVTEVFLPTPGI